MAVPSKGDRLMAKVDLSVYTDRECTKEYPILPPGPNGLRSTVQRPGRRATNEEVGTFTGAMSDAGFEVNFVLKYDIAQQGLLPWKWSYSTVVKSIVAWVKRDQVTGFWDTGVDAPKVPIVEQPVGQNSGDNTNTLLGLAVAGAAFWKFVLPNLRK